MILTLDIGNTNMKTAIFKGMEMQQYWRVSTDRNRTSDEYGMVLMNLMPVYPYQYDIGFQYHFGVTAFLV